MSAKQYWQDGFRPDNYIKGACPMTKHTPGEWKWWDKKTDRPPKYDLAKLIGADDVTILTMYGGNGILALGKEPEDIANARLIAQSPKMLAELERWISLFAEDCSAIGTRVKTTKAIIREARGE